MPTNINKRYYKSVAGNSIDKNEYVIPNGKFVLIRKVGGNSCFHDDVKIQVCFDDECLFSTHGDDMQAVEIELEGDGVKKLTIDLVNDSINSETVGGYYEGQEY